MYHLFMNRKMIQTLSLLIIHIILVLTRLYFQVKMDMQIILFQTWVLLQLNIELVELVLENII